LFQAPISKLHIYFYSPSHIPHAHPISPPSNLECVISVVLMQYANNTTISLYTTLHYCNLKSYMFRLYETAIFTF
jgi:hypothetical protein